MKRLIKIRLLVVYLLAAACFQAFAANIVSDDRFIISKENGKLVIRRNLFYILPHTPVQADVPVSQQLSNSDQLWQYLEGQVLTINTIANNPATFTLTLPTPLDNGVVAVGVGVTPANTGGDQSIPPPPNLQIPHILELLENNIQDTPGTFHGLNHAFSLANLLWTDFFIQLANILVHNQTTDQTTTAPAALNSDGSASPASSNNSISISENGGNLAVNTESSDNASFQPDQHPTVTLTPLNANELDQWNAPAPVPADRVQTPDYFTLWNALKTCQWRRYWNQHWFWQKGGASSAPKKSKQEWIFPPGFVEGKSLAAQLKSCGISVQSSAVHLP